MRKKDYTKSFNFFEYEQQLNEEKNVNKEELQSIEELASLDGSFSVINAPEQTTTQSSDDVFNSVFDVNAKDAPHAAEVFDSSVLNDVDEFDELAFNADKASTNEEQEAIEEQETIEETAIKEPANEDITDKEVVKQEVIEDTTDILTENKEQNIVDEEAEKTTSENVLEQEPEESFNFAVETVLPIAEAPKKTLKVKKSFLKAFKKQKEEAAEEVADEFFVEPVVSDIDDAQLSLDLENTESLAENAVIEEEIEQPILTEITEETGQQFFAEAIMADIIAEITDEENINDIPPVSDESDDFFVEPAEEEIEEALPIQNEEAPQEFIVDEELDEDIDEALNEQEEENPYNIVLDDEPEQEYTEQKASSKLITYEELKKTKPTQFETAYLFKGAKGEHIRFRISSEDEPAAKKAHALQLVKEYAILIVSALLIGLFLNFFIFTFARVKGGSMEPTLHENQTALVSRLEYQFSEIERGDIVITRFPSKNYPDIYVKRVIALSNEKVEIKGGIVYVNGVALDEDYVMAPCKWDMELISVPEGYVFVMGDNRNDSADSRIVGPIPKSQIIGKAKYVIFPSFENIED